MRTYETIFIVHPDVVGDQYAGIIEKFRKSWRTRADILKVEEWGTRKLAYPVKKQVRGTFVLVAYEAGPQVIAEFERRMRIDENIIKFQTVHLEKGLPRGEGRDAPAPAPEEAASTSEELKDE